MKKTVIIVHGGAGPDSEYIQQNLEAYKSGLRECINIGYAILETGGTAVDAVTEAVKYLEDNPLFNAGRGSALNSEGEVEMCASIMNGKDLSSGAVAIVKTIRNPVTLARAVMEETDHTYLGADGAEELGISLGLPLEEAEYFKTTYNIETYHKQLKENGSKVHGEPPMAAGRHGTVGAAACDAQGNIAAATSTGGIDFCMKGRIADSSMVGIGSYANNNTCAVSATGDGEYLMKYVVSHDIHAVIEYKNVPLREAAHYVIQQKLQDICGDIGIIAVTANGDFAFEFNSERMHRAWRTSAGEEGVGVYKEG